jgi:hypothetical protein
MKQSENEALIVARFGVLPLCNIDVFGVKISSFV